MIIIHWMKISRAILLGMILLSLQVNSSATFAQTNSTLVREVRVMEAEKMGVSNTAGLFFSPRANAFYVMDGKKRGQANTDLIKLSPFADRVGSARIAAAINDPRTMAFDRRFNRLVIYQSSSNQLIEVQEKSDGNLDPRTMVRQNARRFGLQNPQGLTIDPVNGHLFFLDATGPRLVHVEPAPDGTFNTAVISEVDLRSFGLKDVRGIALDPTTSHLHLLTVKTLYELTQAGQVVATRDLTEFGFKDPQGIVFAPSGDLTDNPSEISLYITEQGAAATPITNAIGNASAPTPGGIVELSFTALAAPAATTAEGTLIRTIDTSQFSPPSPDPSGLAYLPDSGTLLISDGEVDEMPPYFAGVNLFEVSLSGSLLHTFTTTSFSDEPAGVEVNPVNRH